jgi:nitroreductase/FMN reductase [NAD(P)H]
MSGAKTGLEADFHARFGLEAPAGFGAEIADAGLAPAATAALSRILARRSYRRFSDQPVPEALLLLVFCGDLRRAQRVCELRGHAHAQNTLDSFMNAAVDAALAMQSLIAAAEAAGLGCCCISQVRKRLPETAELLGLPDGVFPVAGLAAGWPDEARDVTRRLPASVVVHRDAYDDSGLGAEIDAYDQRRHAVRPLANQIKPEKFGTADFYGWSENAARRLAEPSDLGGLRAFLAAHGFDLD